MKSKVFKKTVDSVRKRSGQRGFALNTEKIRKKRLISSISLAKNTSKSRIAILMQNSAIRITALILIITINWLGISAIGRTSAYFTDIETSEGNVFSAGTLDFSLTSPTKDFVPKNNCNDHENDDNNEGENEDGNKNKNDNDNNKHHDKNNNDHHHDDETQDMDSLVREIRITNIGSMSFRYIPSIKNISGDLDLCEILSLRMELAGETKYSGNFGSFDLVSIPLVIDKGSTDVFKFIIDFSGDNPDDNKLCQFDLSFYAWQVDLDPEYGFGTIKEIQNTIKNISVDGHGNNDHGSGSGNNSNDGGNNDQGENDDQQAENALSGLDADPEEKIEVLSEDLAKDIEKNKEKEDAQTTPAAEEGENAEKNKNSEPDTPGEDPIATEEGTAVENDQTPIVTPDAILTVEEKKTIEEPVTPTNDPAIENPDNGSLTGEILSSAPASENPIEIPAEN